MLILTASVGHGHVRAAEAVASAVERAMRRRGATRPVAVVDMLEQCSRLVRTLCRDAYVGLVQYAPSVVGWLYRRSDRPARTGLRGRMLWAGLRSLRRQVEFGGAEIVVSTHFLASEVVARLVREGRAPPLQTVVTDVDAHAWWIWPGTERYFVAGDRGRRTLAAAGVDTAAIEPSGIPIDPVFEQVPPRAWARSVLGLDPDRPVILLSTGGCCVGPVDGLLLELARLRTPAQVVVICGRSERARERLAAAAAAAIVAPGVSIRVEGFTDRMQVWMAAADLFLGKPGGLTSSECLAAGLPMVIVHAIPGQEEHNADELVRRGAAVRIGAADARGGVAPAIEALLRSPDRLAAIRSCALASAAPAAARHIAERVLSRLEDRTRARAAGALQAPGASPPTH